MIPTTIGARAAAVMLAMVLTNAVAHDKPNPVVAKPPQALSAESAKVLAVVNQLRDAIRTGDAALATLAMAETVSIYEQGHVESSRAEYLSHHFNEDVAFAKLVPSKVVDSTVIVEGRMALVTATTTTDGTYKDKPVKSAGVETYVLRLRDGNWRIEHAHWSSRKRP